jgi:hypothetical protein
MIKQLRYDFFQVVMPPDTEVTFETLLHEINALGQRERLYHGDYPVRLHDLVPRRNYLLGDIARIRMNDIPDKMKLTGETEPLDLAEDEGLGEFATFLYHPRTNILMMMRNRNAVSVSGLNTYLENIGGIEGIEFNYVLQVEAYQRLQRLDRIQRFDLEVAAPGHGSIFTDMGLSPQSVAGIMGVAPRVRLSVSLSTGYEKEVSLPRAAIERLVTAFRQRARRDDESMSIVVSGREQNQEKEIIDMFEDVLTDFVDVNIRNQRRISDEQRHTAIREVWGRHRERLIGIFGQAG